MQIKLKKIIPVFVFLVVISGTLSAHPHIFINPTVEVLVNNNNLSGVRITWVWDKWSSENVMTDCDTNKDGTLNDQEVQLVYQYYFANLRNFDYFTEIFVNGKSVRIRNISGFSVYLRGDRCISMSFIVPITSHTEIPTKIGFCFNDQTYYVAFEQNVTVKPIRGHEIKNFKKGTYSYYGLQFLFYLN